MNRFARLVFTVFVSLQPLTACSQELEELADGFVSPTAAARNAQISERLAKANTIVCQVFPPGQPDERLWLAFAQRKLTTCERRVFDVAEVALQDSFTPNYWSAVTLGRLGHESATELLWARASNEFAPSLQRAHAIAALASIPHPQLLQRLVDLVHDPRVAIDAVRALVLLTNNSMQLTEEELGRLNEFYTNPRRREGVEGHGGYLNLGPPEPVARLVFGGSRDVRITPYGPDLLGDRIRENQIPAELMDYCALMQQRLRTWLRQPPPHLNYYRHYYYSLLPFDVLTEEERLKQITAPSPYSVPNDAHGQDDYRGSFKQPGWYLADILDNTIPRSPVKEVNIGALATKALLSGRDPLRQSTLRAGKALGPSPSKDDFEKIRQALKEAHSPVAPLLDPFTTRTARLESIALANPSGASSSLESQALFAVAVNGFEDVEIRRQCVDQLVAFPQASNELIRLVADPRVGTIKLIERVAHAHSVSIDEFTRHQAKSQTLQFEAAWELYKRIQNSRP